MRNINWKLNKINPNFENRKLLFIFVVIIIIIIIITVNIQTKAICASVIYQVLEFQ